MDVSIIIVNYYTEKLIIDCLKSVYDKTVGIEFEVIIVDNNSNPNFAEIIGNEFPYNNIKFLPLKENIGFGRANNEGFKISTGRNIFCLNPDTVLLNNAVKILSDYLDSHPECGACGGNLFDMEQRPIHSYRMTLPGVIDSLVMLSNYTLAKLIWSENHEFNHTAQPMEVGYITGADLMIPRKIYKATGGFDSNFFLYYEETDLCKRIKNLGKLIVSVPASQIIHLVGQTHNKNDKSTSINEIVFKSEGESRRIYFNKHLGRFERLISIGIIKVNFCFRLFLAYLHNDTTAKISLKYRLKYI